MNDLRSLGELYGTDKVSHGFCEVYHELFKDKRNEIKNVLEIGVFFGASIMMWNEYFANALIHGFDTFNGVQGNGHIFQDPAKFYDEWNNKKLNNIVLHKFDQSSIEQLEEFKNLIDFKFDIIIDDGSHLMRDQQITLKYLLPLVKPKGYYIIEDLHSSIDNKFYDVKKDYSNTTKRMIEEYGETGELKSEYIDMANLPKLINSIDIITTEQRGMTAIIKVNE